MVVCSAGVSSLNGKVSDLLVSLVSLLLIQSHCSSDPELFFPESRSHTAGSTDAFWSLIHVPTLLGHLPFRVGRRCRTVQSRTVSLTAEDLSSHTYTLENDAILTDFSIMCEDPDHLLHKNQQLNFRKGCKISTQN